MHERKLAYLADALSPKSLAAQPKQKVVHVQRILASKAGSQLLRCTGLPLASWIQNHQHTPQQVGDVIHAYTIRWADVLRCRGPAFRLCNP